jgi:hypothetical protein
MRFFAEIGCGKSIRESLALFLSPQIQTEPRVASARKKWAKKDTFRFVAAANERLQK